MPAWRVILYDENRAVLVETRVGALNIIDAITKAALGWREIEQVTIINRGKRIEAERLPA